VNPHAALFITSDGQQLNQSRLRRNIEKILRNLMGNEVRHLINQMYCIGLIPLYVQGIVDIVMQSYRGHVTIAPSPTLNDYLGILTDVEKQKLHLYI